MTMRQALYGIGIALAVLLASVPSYKQGSETEAQKQARQSDAAIHRAHLYFADLEASGELARLREPSGKSANRSGGVNRLGSDARSVRAPRRGDLHPTTAER